MFINQQKLAIGLDISARYLRLAQIKKRSGKPCLVSMAELELPEGIIKNGQFQDIRQSAEQIKKLVKKNIGQKIYGRYCVACLPEQETFIKIIDLPAISGDTNQAVIDEAKKHIPYPLEKAYLDWSYINNRDTTKVVIAVCPKEIVENYQTVLNQAGLSPIALEIEAVAIARSLFPLNKIISAPVIIVDLGANRTGLIIYEQDYIPFSLSLKISSDDLTEKLRANLNLTPEQAKQAKEKIGLDPDKAQGGVLTILKDQINELAEEIREAKYFYYEHCASKETIKQIYLTGGGANMKNLPAILSDLTKLEVVIGNPLVNLGLGPVELPESKSLSFATAIGLALRSYQN